MKPCHALPLLLASLSACTTVPYDHPDAEPAPYYDTRYSSYDYYYYPSVAVYFHLRSGYYYYRDRDHWLKVRHLPPHIHLDREFHRHLFIRDEFPYLRHEEHERLYGPGHGQAPGQDRDGRERESDRRPPGQYEPRREPPPPAERRPAPVDQRQPNSQGTPPGHNAGQRDGGHNQDRNRVPPPPPARTDQDAGQRDDPQAKPLPDGADASSRRSAPPGTRKPAWEDPRDNDGNSRGAPANEKPR